MALDNVSNDRRNVAELQVGPTPEFVSDIFGNVGAPALGDIERDHPSGVTVLSLEKAQDNGLQVGKLAVGFYECSTGREIVLNQVHRWVGRDRHDGRHPIETRIKATPTKTEDFKSPFRAIFQEAKRYSLLVDARNRPPSLQFSPSHWRPFMYRLKALFVAVLITSLPIGAALGQSGGGGGSAGGGTGAGASGGAAGAASGAGGVSGSTLSNGSSISGTGGSPGPNTANALNKGTSGNNMGAPQTGSAQGAPASHGNAVDTPAANSAMHSLGNTDAGVLKK